MGLSGAIGHIGRHDEVVEHRIIGFRHRQRHIHLEGAVRLRDGLTRSDLRILIEAAEIATIPVSTVGNPPEGPPPLHTILHLGLLHRHAGIALGGGLHGHGVTCFIIFLIRVEFHLEGWSFVFLHPEGMPAVA